MFTVADSSEKMANTGHNITEAIESMLGTTAQTSTFTETLHNYSHSKGWDKTRFTFAVISNNDRQFP